ncbi:hypothetical protein TRVL_09752 [Trypanosoma vivax]|nr:hypothetical protein TRVL_09752 [Trypanosoma vivax]
MDEFLLFWTRTGAPSNAASDLMAQSLSMAMSEMEFHPSTLTLFVTTLPHPQPQCGTVRNTANSSPLAGHEWASDHTESCGLSSLCAALPHYYFLPRVALTVHTFPPSLPFTLLSVFVSTYLPITLCSSFPRV